MAPPTRETKRPFSFRANLFSSAPYTALFSKRFRERFGAWVHLIPSQKTTTSQGQVVTARAPVRWQEVSCAWLTPVSSCSPQMGCALFGAVHTSCSCVSELESRVFPDLAGVDLDHARRGGNRHQGVIYLSGAGRGKDVLYQERKNQTTRGNVPLGDVWMLPSVPISLVIVNT